METLNDLHGDLINLARVLADEKAAIQLYGRLSKTLMHEQVYKDARERAFSHKFENAPCNPDVVRATDFMMVAWMGINGVAGTGRSNYQFAMRYTKNGGHAAKRWVSAVDSIPEWHQRLRHVTMVNRDGMELLERWEDADRVVIYVDPPYLKKGAKYVHDFEGEDHLILADHLSRFSKTRVVISYYDDPRLDDLYPGWTKRRLKATKSLVNQGMRDQGGAVEAPEILLINGPSLVEQPGAGQLEMF